MKTKNKTITNMNDDVLIDIFETVCESYVDFSIELFKRYEQKSFTIEQKEKIANIQLAASAIIYDKIETINQIKGELKNE